MITIKLAPALPKTAIPDLDASQMWDNLGGHYMAIVELRVAERTEPADDEESDPGARLKVTRLELARGSHDDEQLRKALLARFKARTAIGTLDEEATAAAASADGSVDISLPEALLDFVNAQGEVGGHPAKASRTNGLLTIEVDVT